MVDQFEELFASTVSESDLAEVIDTLAELCADTRTVVVIGMRADFFHRAATLRSCSKVFNRTQSS